MSIRRSYHRQIFPVIALAVTGALGIIPASAESQSTGQTEDTREPDKSRRHRLDPPGPRVSLSNFSDRIFDGGSGQSVQADLFNSDTVKPAVFDWDVVHAKLDHYYSFKRRLNDGIGLAFTADYSALIQRASWVQGDDRTGLSHVLRFLGNWLTIGQPEGMNGSLIWKVEGRDNVGGHPAPRDLGFDTGSALSTANYKELKWGVTNLYWKQTFNNRDHSVLIGHLDPGDWADQYPLLNAWTLFMNDAFYNNPAEAIPKQGFALVYQGYATDSVYLLAGVADANGKGSELDFASFWDTREWFTWVEIGFRANRSITARQNTHLHYWHQDAREEAGTSESWGLVYTYSAILDNGAVPFVRIGYSEGDAPQLRQSVSVGIRLKVFGRDSLGLGVNWGAPPDKSLRSQFTSEAFYRIQMTQNLTVTPSVQVTYKPSLTLEKDWIVVAGFRLRLVF